MNTARNRGAEVRGEAHRKVLKADAQGRRTAPRCRMCGAGATLIDALIDERDERLIDDLFSHEDTEHQKRDAQHEENEKQNLGDRGRTGGDSRKTKQGRNNGHNSKEQCHLEHSFSPDERGRAGHRLIASGARPRPV
ncbi:hypothetical protein PT2222_30281 [Paraburkholderia tropica]